MNYWLEEELAQPRGQIMSQLSWPDWLTKAMQAPDGPAALPAPADDVTVEAPAPLTRADLAGAARAVRDYVLRNLAALTECLDAVDRDVDRLWDHLEQELPARLNAKAGRDALAAVKAELSALVGKLVRRAAAELRAECHAEFQAYRDDAEARHADQLAELRQECRERLQQLHTDHQAHLEACRRLVELALSRGQQAPPTGPGLVVERGAVSVNVGGAEVSVPPEAIKVELPPRQTVRKSIEYAADGRPVGIVETTEAVQEEGGAAP